MNIGSAIFNPIVRLVKPEPKPAPVASWQGFHVVWDIMGRLREVPDGLDKTNKFILGLFVNGGLLWFNGDAPRVKELGDYLWNVNDFFGGVGFFGRAQEVIGYNKKSGRFLLQERNEVKGASVVTLAVGKAAEFGKLCQKVDLAPSAATLAAFDANYLGGLASQIGETSIVRTLGLNTLGGTKNLFIIASASLAILDHITNLVDAKVWDKKTLVKIGIGLANDTGKIIMITWFYWFTITWSFVAVSSTVALIGMTKVLFDSYSATGLPKFLK